MHSWYSLANWYSQVQSSTQHYELRETWEEACNKKFEENLKQFSKQEVVKYTPLHHPGPKFHTAPLAEKNLGRRVGAPDKAITLC